MTTDQKTFIEDHSRRDALRLMAASAATGIFATNLLGKPAHAQTRPAPKGRVVVGVTQEPTVFNPLMPHLEVDDSIAFSVFDALFRIEPKGAIVPNLAAEVPSQANGGISADGLKWRVRLRNNVRWHDGTP
jgi:peptide/nickel transport system substrate-binding protein